MILRLVVRLVRQGQSLTICDWLLVASMFDAIALFTTDVLAYKLGALGEYPSTEAGQISLKKVTFAGNYLYDTGIYFPKLALCALYYKLIPPTMPKLRKIMFGVSGLTLVFMISTCFLDTFWCGGDPSVNWSLEEGACSTYESKEVFRIDWVMNIVSDVLSESSTPDAAFWWLPLCLQVVVFSLPFPLLKGLQLKPRYIAGVAAIFSAGIITVAASVSRFATVEVIHNWPNVCRFPRLQYIRSSPQQRLTEDRRYLIHDRNGRRHHRGLATRAQIAPAPSRRGLDRAVRRLREGRHGEKSGLVEPCEAVLREGPLHGLGAGGLGGGLGERGGAQPAWT